MELDLEALEVMTNRLNEEKRQREIKEHNARMMREALGRADV
jgi:hypothetical protein